MWESWLAELGGRAVQQKGKLERVGGGTVLMVRVCARLCVKAC